MEKRQAYAASFDFDLDRLFADLKTKEAQNPAPRSPARALTLKPSKVAQQTLIKGTGSPIFGTTSAPHPPVYRDFAV